MKSPLFKFSCGCIGISLDRPSERVADATEVWLFHACDADDDGVIGGIRPLSNDKIVKAVPLTEQEFEKVRMQTQQQLQAGEAMFDLHRSLYRGMGCLDRFRNAGKPEQKHD